MKIKNWMLASAAFLMLAPAAYAQDSGTANQNSDQGAPGQSEPANQDSSQDLPGQTEPGAEDAALDQQGPAVEGNKEQDTAAEGEALSPEEEMRPAAGTSLPDDEFARDVASANQFEIRSSQLALERAESPEVRDFAQQMIDDHTQAAQEFSQAHGSSMSTASGSGMATDTGALSAKHRQALAALEEAEGAEFDQLYIQMQTKAHEEGVQKFRTYSQTGMDHELRDFAADRLPTMQEHWQEIQAIDERV